MTAITQATELQAALVRECDDEEERCTYLASVLRILANAVDHTDAYGPLVDLAGEIEHCAEHNIIARSLREQRTHWRDAA